MRRWRWVICCVFFALAAIVPCHAQQAEPATLDMQAVVVSGAQPGPGMWKVSRGEHVLWILGTVAPLPGGIEWQADEVREVLQRADQVLGHPGVSVGTDIGFFRGMLLLPAAMKATKNPDGKTLHDILPPDTHARWQKQKQRYLGRDDGIEKKRPFIAAEELYAQAIKQVGLGGKVVTPVVDKVLKQRKMEYTSTTLKISVDDPKAAIADFRKEQLGVQELACMNDMLTTVERDLPRMVERANAWAVGDVPALRMLPLTERESCWLAWSDTEALRKRGLADIRDRMRARWLEVASAALEKNATTFALLPVETLLREDGVLAAFAAKGYTVEAPE
ncbi:MAG: TraB/GumN family protein [Pseudoxanthomonas sp.]